MQGVTFIDRDNLKLASSSSFLCVRFFFSIVVICFALFCFILFSGRCNVVINIIETLHCAECNMTLFGSGQMLLHEPKGILLKTYLNHIHLYAMPVMCDIIGHFASYHMEYDIKPHTMMQSTLAVIYTPSMCKYTPMTCFCECSLTW